MCRYCNAIEKEHFSSPKEGDLRVWWVPQVPSKPFRYPVQSLAEAKKMLDVFAQYDLFQLEHMIKPDFANMGGLEVFEDNEWCDWQNEDGYDIKSVDENGNDLD